jgi:hypothetical protein
MATFSIGLTISAAGEHLHNPATNTAKMAKWPCIEMAGTVFYSGYYLHSPWAPGCGSCIIHVFWFSFARYRVCDGFQIHSGSFCPFGSGDIFFVLCNGFGALPHYGIHHNNRPVL